MVISQPLLTYLIGFHHLDIILYALLESAYKNGEILKNNLLMTSSRLRTNVEWLGGGGAMNAPSLSVGLSNGRIVCVAGVCRSLFNYFFYTVM